MLKILSPTLAYIGVDDVDLDLFENQYILPKGMAYNSYLFLDDKVAVLDTADARVGQEWKANLVEALNGRMPDYLIVQHLEPDHSSLIEWVLAEYPNITVVAGAKALQMLPQFLDSPVSYTVLPVKDGDTLSLGRHELCFYTAPMVHWPEVIVTYDKSDCVLYSADAFGKFGALSRCGFTSEEEKDWESEARRYYFNIVGKYGVPVQTLLKKLSSLTIRGIRSLHGPLLEANLDKYLSLYQAWSTYSPTKEGVLIVCSSIYGNTMKASVKLQEILEGLGDEVEFVDLCKSDMSENVGKAFEYSKIVFASSSYEGGLYTPMRDYLYRLQSKGLCGRKAGLIENGSWAPSAGRVMREMLAGMKDMEISPTIVSIHSHMKETDMPALNALAYEMHS